MIERDLPRSVYVPAAAPRPWALCEFIGHDRLRLFSVARWGLVEALRLAKADGRAVLMPDYICREVLASVAEAGADVAFYPVGKDMELAADPDDLPEAAAIMSVNYFGFPQNLSPFEEYARRAGAVVIEDNAHGLLSRDDAGRPLGTRAALGILSMRKTVPLLDGGALAVNDPALWPQVAPQLEPASQTGAGLAFMKKRRAVRGLARWIGARRMVSAIRGARFLRKLRTGVELPASDPDAERRIAAGPAPCGEATLPYRSAEPRLEVRRRRDLYALCEKLLAPAGIEPVFPRLPEGVSPYAYPFRASSPAADRAEAILAANGLFTLPWPALPDAVASKAPEFHHTVRAVHFLW